MDIAYCQIGSVATDDKSLFLVQQNIRGTTSKIEDIIGAFRMDKLNSQALCFTERHTVEENLCRINIKNYELGSYFSQGTYQMGGACIFIEKEIHYTSPDVSKLCVDKTLEI
jgi:hypothetical protein